MTEKPRTKHLPGDGMDLTLEQIRTGLKDDQTHLVARGQDDPEGPFLSVNARGEMANELYNLLCEIGIIEVPEEKPGAKA